MVLAVTLPLYGALGIAVTGSRPNLREAVTLVTATSLIFTVFSLLPDVMAGGRPAITLWEMQPGLSLKLEVEPLGMLFACVASFLWLLTSVYSIGYMRGNAEDHQTRFYVFFAIALASTMGVAFAGNLFTLFVFYETLTLSTYPLVTHHGDAEAKEGGRTYLGVLLSTSIGFLLVAIIWTWSATGRVDFVPGGILSGHVHGWQVGLLLALFAFGIGKAALMPFHRWLPAAMVAPTPVSALLHAVAVVKAGVFSVVKVLVYIFGIDLLAAEPSTRWLPYAAAFTIVVASLVALRQDNLKRRLAYSTVSQLSYVVLGASVATAMGVMGGSLQIAMHAFGKITLFFCAGAIYTATHKTEISQMDGLARAMPFTYAAFLLGALSVIGLPPLGGTWSKFFLILGAADAGDQLLVATLLLSSLLNVGYLLPPVLRGFFARPAVPIMGIHEAPVACVLPLALTAAGCVALFFFADLPYALILPVAVGK
jgi:multicomponent Na+:H+ antiporter subunit D